LTTRRSPSRRATSLAALACGVAVAAVGCGGSSSNSTPRRTTTTRATTLAPVTTTTVPATTVPPPTTAAGASSPTAALASYLSAQGHEYANDCSAANPATDVGKWCSLVRDDGADQKVYGVGPVAAEVVTIVTVQRNGSGWVVTSTEAAPQAGA
jgi:hypothetical protein